MTKTNNKEMKTYYQTEATTNFYEGERDSWTEKEDNLSQNGNALDYGSAWVCSGSEVSGVLKIRQGYLDDKNSESVTKEEHDFRFSHYEDILGPITTGPSQKIAVIVCRHCGQIIKQSLWC